MKSWNGKISFCCVWSNSKTEIYVPSSSTVIVSKDGEGVRKRSIVKWTVGSSFSADYLKALYGAVLQHCPSSGCDVEFVCLTDKVEEAESVLKTSENGIRFRVEKLNNEWPGWWSKIELFRPDLFDLGSWIIYFDLDSMIVGSLYPFLRLPQLLKLSFGEDNVFCALRPFGNLERIRGVFGSGIMCWFGNSDDFVSIYDGFSFPSTAEQFRGDQDYISFKVAQATSRIRLMLLQEIIVGIYSYKKDIRHRMLSLPSDARVICFHGNPRPHEIVDEEKWAKDYWYRMTGNLALSSIASQEV